ncbi:MAG: hypothetical protein BROFUL_00903 [Candidatus Brocadia fulgida]|uniref:Glycosyltransferase n=1 Tax=Candidatus Brocadia fulgida TaxID=380242 RepID=A0A0M2UX04_9BACT|nr:MAG: hypothetical protein BROFUL_00903 [Candidatus Brocadia fulgida]
MKILIIHNFYQSSSPSGEDIVFKNEVELLRKNRINVITYEKYNDDIANDSNRLKLAFRTIWSRETYKELKTLITKEKPDIAHFHNIWYQISPSAYYACKDAGIPVVQTLHNFRLFCASGLLMRVGKVCEECIGRMPWKGAFYGCYRNSRLYSLPVALTQVIHRFIGTWTNKVDAYIALTNFGRNKFIEHGLPAEKIFVKPNFLLNSHNPPLAGSEIKFCVQPVGAIHELPLDIINGQRLSEQYQSENNLSKGDRKFSHGNYIVFLGRISYEKGIEILVDAFKMLRSMTHKEVFLKIVGDGPLKKQIEDRVGIERIPNIEFTGRKSHSESMEILKDALFMVTSSIWYEMFPMTVLETFSCGKAVIAPRLGR